MSRAKWKNPFNKYSKKNTEKLPVLKKNFEITPHIIGKTIKVYNGKSFIKLPITDEMIGSKIGEFITTREKFIFKKKRKTQKK